MADFTAEEQRVALSAAKPTVTVDAKLTPLAPPAPVARTGSLVIESRPAGARAFIDGRDLGTTPVSLPDVAPGPHRVRIELAGFTPVGDDGGDQGGGAFARRRVAGAGTSAMKAVLALEDGTIYRGTSIGTQGETRGEVVFNTSMTGYQEVLTDPSYAGQIVTMTSSQIGNYGVSSEDVESKRPQVAGFIVRESSPVASNWRADQQLSEYLAANNIVAIADIDTRALTRKLRSGGVLRGIIATGEPDGEALAGPGAGDPEDGRHRPGARGHLRGPVRLAGRRRRRARGLPRAAGTARQEAPDDRRLRPGDQAEHPAQAGRAQLRRARVPGLGAGFGPAGRKP
jgi:hypothetical protein